MISVVDHETTSDIVVQDMILMTVTEADARAAGIPRQRLTQAYAEKIRAAVKTYKTERSLRNLLIDAAQALAVTLVLVSLLALLKRYVPRLITLIESWKGTRIRTLRFQTIELLHEDRAVAMLLSLLRTLRTIVVIGLLYLYIPLVLSFSPGPKGWRPGCSVTSKHRWSRSGMPA